MGLIQKGVGFGSNDYSYTVELYFDWYGTHRCNNEVDDILLPGITALSQ